MKPYSQERAMNDDPSHMLRAAGRLAAAAERKERGGVNREAANREYWQALRMYRRALHRASGGKSLAVV